MPCVYLPGPAPAVTVANSYSLEQARPYRRGAGESGGYTQAINQGTVGNAQAMLHRSPAQRRGLRSNGDKRTDPDFTEEDQKALSAVLKQQDCSDGGSKARSKAQAVSHTKGQRRNCRATAATRRRAWEAGRWRRVGGGAECHTLFTRDMETCQAGLQRAHRTMGIWSREAAEVGS
jgi:hypothetical protein